MPKQSHMGNDWLPRQSTHGAQIAAPHLCGGQRLLHMKHFHLSQGDKLAGLDRPLYLQKKIKSVLTLAVFIGNTCRLVIVLNSLCSLVSGPRPGLGWPRHLHGISSHLEVP